MAILAVTKNVSHLKQMERSSVKHKGKIPVNAVKTALSSLWKMIPENHAKHGVRSVLMRYKPHPNRRFLVNPGDTVLQVGAAGAGIVEWVLSIVGPQGRVVALEPDERNFKKLAASPLLQSEQVILKNVAAWSKREKLMLTVSHNPADNKIAVEEVLHDNDLVPDNYIHEQEAQADTVDNILKSLDISHIDFAEIHVNGAELEVLKGMEETLPNACRLHIKAHALVGDDKVPLNQLIKEFLEERGFKIVIARSTEARTEAAAHGWTVRDGDLYAWNPSFKKHR